METQNLEISRIPFSNMLKSEASELAKKTIGIVQNHNPELLLLENILGKLEDLMPDVEKMSYNYGIDPKRQKIETKKSLLMLTISGLKLEAKKLEKKGMDDDLILIKSFIDANLRSLYKTKNDKELTQKVNGFLHIIESDETLATAMETKSLMKPLDEIKLAFRDLKLTMAQRVSLLAERPKYNTPLIVSNIADALENLFKTIEVFQMSNPELDYTALIEELNQQARMYRRSINIRLANNKRRLEAKKEGETDIDADTDSDAPIEEDVPEPVNHRTYRSSGSSNTYFMTDSEEEENEDSAYEDEDVEEDFESSFEDTLDDEENTTAIE